MGTRTIFLVGLVVALSGCCLDTIEGRGGTAGGTTGESTTGGTTGGLDSGPPQTCPQDGPCGSDNDCVVAWCAGVTCGGCSHYAVSKSLISGAPCLVVIGPVDGPTTGSPSPACNLAPDTCDCAAFPSCVPQCSSGACQCAPTL